MKNLLIALFTMFYFGISAQTLNYKEGIIEYEGEIVSTIDVILSPRVNTIEDKFEKWMESNYHVELNERNILSIEKEFMTANGIVIPKISSKKIDLIVKVSESEDYNTVLNVIGSFGYNNWITKEDFPIEYNALEDLVYEFVTNFLPEYYLDRMETNEDHLTILSNTRDDLAGQLVANNEEIKLIEAENTVLMQKIKANRKRVNMNKSILLKKEMEYEIVKDRIEQIK